MRILKDEVEDGPYFVKGEKPSTIDEGTREMYPLYPFVISGGANTERYYFQHISKLTKYKLNIEPKYFGNESQYTKQFPKIVKEILKKNDGAVVFCVFDMDTVIGNTTRMASHHAFEKVMEGKAMLCPSMPSIEYWFLLHFEDCCDYLRNWKDVSRRLANHIRPCFPNPQGINLKDLLKKRKNVEDSHWVEELCKDGKMNHAIAWAKRHYKDALESGSLTGKSYSRVYLIFEIWDQLFSGEKNFDKQ